MIEIVGICRVLWVRRGLLLWCCLESVFLLLMCCRDLEKVVMLIWHVCVCSCCQFLVLYPCQRMLQFWPCLCELSLWTFVCCQAVGREVAEGRSDIGLVLWDLACWYWEQQRNTLSSPCLPSCLLYWFSSSSVLRFSVDLKISCVFQICVCWVFS